jgi:hypothetical protein
VLVGTVATRSCTGRVEVERERGAGVVTIGEEEVEEGTG